MINTRFLGKGYQNRARVLDLVKRLVVPKGGGTAYLNGLNRAQLLDLLSNSSTWAEEVDLQRQALLRMLHGETQSAAYFPLAWRLSDPPFMFLKHALGHAICAFPVWIDESNVPSFEFLCFRKRKQDELQFSLGLAVDVWTDLEPDEQDPKGDHPLSLMRCRSWTPFRDLISGLVQ